MEVLLKEYCWEEHTTLLWRLWTNARAGGREETRDRKIETIKTLHLHPDPKKGGVLCPLLPRVPNLATSGNITTLLGPLLVSHTAPSPSEWMELSHSQIQIGNNFLCLCVCLYTDMLIYSSCMQLKCLQSTIFGCSVPFFDAVFLWRSEPTFQCWPLAMWGPRQGQRGSNAGIVLHAQHAFSLLAVRHGTSKQSLIPQSWIH